MTISHGIRSHADRIRPGEAAFGFLGLFCLFLLLRNAEVGVEWMSRGLRLCAESVIPSLFPSMVLSEFLVSGRTATRIGSTVGRPIGRLLNLSPAGSSAFLLGALCGFPVGARCALRSLEQGELATEECERLLGVCGMPSSAFLIGTVGVTFLGDRRIGILLWCSVLLSSLVVGRLEGMLAERNGYRAACSQPKYTSAAPALSPVRAFTEAIRHATTGMLTICAYVVFFSAILGVLREMLAGILENGMISAIFFSSLELSNGMQMAAELTSPLAAALLCASAAGWSGLSVHCQLLSLCDGFALSFRRYFRDKVLLAAVCPAVITIQWSIFY